MTSGTASMQPAASAPPSKEYVPRHAAWLAEAGVEAVDAVVDAVVEAAVETRLFKAEPTGADDESAKSTDARRSWRRKAAPAPKPAS